MKPVFHWHENGTDLKDAESEISLSDSGIKKFRLFLRMR